MDYQFSHKSNFGILSVERKESMERIRCRLLIVDDELSSRRLLTYLLDPHYSVFCANNGQEAKTWLDEGNKADLIITDIQMPIMDGISLIELLEKEVAYKNVPVIVISSQSEEQINGRLQKPLVYGLLNKPIDPKTLYWRIEKVLRQNVIL